MQLCLMLLTADLKYHQFYEAETTPFSRYGHFESERYTKNYIVDYLRKKILNFAIILSEENTNQLSTYRIWRIRKN
jgi:putative NIF3 family GTP cyclohydrolase 1 type 2